MERIYLAAWRYADFRAELSVCIGLVPKQAEEKDGYNDVDGVIENELVRVGLDPQQIFDRILEDA